MKNYSRQREAILTVLRSTVTHPTADWIYSQVRLQIPNISLGTVYRNLAALSNAGEILKIDVGDGKEHFDGNASPHLHLCCKKCGSIDDVMLEKDPFGELGHTNGFIPETNTYVICGCCKNCG